MATFQKFHPSIKTPQGSGRHFWQVDFLEVDISLTIILEYGYGFCGAFSISQSLSRLEN
jgi:hypothetical protein